MPTLTPLSRTVLLAALAGVGCTNGTSDGVRIELVGPADVVPADGFTQVTLTANVTPPGAAEALKFSIAGSGGELSATNVPVVDGVATVTLYAPPESALTGPSGASTVTAELPLITGTSVVGTADISFGLPTAGEPKLIVTTAPEFVVVGTGASMLLTIEGRRLSSTTLTLSANSDAVTIPAELVLEGDNALASNTIEIAAPAEPADVEVTITGGGASTTVTLHFIAEGENAFILTGTFAQVTFGRKRISNFGLLANDPDCVAADSISLVRITQNGDEITMESDTCDLKMPTVKLDFFGITADITPPVTAGFLAATNLRDPGPMTFSVAGGAYDVPADQLKPFVMGADLDDPVNDPLPSTDDDPAWADDDGDGTPGVTIPGGSGMPDTFICTRTFTDDMSGVVESSQVIHGELTTRSFSETWNGAFGGPTIHDAPSPFHMLRVDGVNTLLNIAGRSGNADEIDCEDVKRFADELIAQFVRPELVCE